MISAKGLYARKSRAEGREFLKYSMLPRGARSLTVTVLSLREAPKLDSPCVIDYLPEAICDGQKVTLQADSIAINLTNLKALGNLIGDDVSVIAGGKVTFHFSWKDNPKAKLGEANEVMGFDLVAAELPAHIVKERAEAAAAQAATAAPSDPPPAAAPDKPGRRTRA